MQWHRDQKKLHRKYATMIINKATEIFEKEESLTRVEIDDLEEITVCGDVHGQFYDLLNIFHLNGMPSEENPYLFNGDFIDRGSFSVEVILTLLSWKVCYPQHFFMTRGNHEAMSLNKMWCIDIKTNAPPSTKHGNTFNYRFSKCFAMHRIGRKYIPCVNIIPISYQLG
jgi:serine/threonine-protein phosphatase 5